MRVSKKVSGIAISPSPSLDPSKMAEDMAELDVLSAVFGLVFVVVVSAIAFLVYKLRILHRYIYKVRIFFSNSYLKKIRFSVLN